MRLYRFPYSGYSRFVQAAIELTGAECAWVDVPYGNREELALRTGGSILVPVLELDDGRVVTDSRRIAATLVDEDRRFSTLVPDADAGPIWAYVDWAGTLLEDVAFRLAAPKLAQRMSTAFERALFVWSKERKYGEGAVDAWAADAPRLTSQLRALLAPSALSLASRPFLFGRRPSLADAALFGQLVMLDFGAPDVVASLEPAMLRWRQRLQERMGPPPYGPVASAHHSTDELDARLARAARTPREGRLECIVVRTGEHQRACPQQVRLDPEGGIEGDRWARSRPLRPDAQVSLMDVRVAGAVAAREDWPLFGDNFYVDLDLGKDSLPAGQRLRLGSALLEITEEPHHGCRKFASRFGSAALRWVNEREQAHARRRGVFARVVEGGVVQVGDTLRPW